MRIAYFDCFSGVSGDMILGALVDAGLDVERLRAELARLPVSDYTLSAETVRRRGLRGTHVEVTISEVGVERHLHQIEEIISGSDLPDEVKQLSLAIFQRLARAEAHVHSIPMDHVHFHEVGAADSIVDIVAACCALHLLGIERVLCSPITVGSGTIECAHGTLPVPSPATAELLIGAKTAPAQLQGEVTTPTAAAVLTTLADDLRPLPAMQIQAVGYGAGSRESQAMPNVLRVYVGEESDEGQADSLIELSANIDDCTGEMIGSAVEKLLALGCADAWAAPVFMKRSRPAWTLSALVSPGDLDAAERLIFAETTTFGIRRRTVERSKLERRFETVETAYGPIRIKVGSRGGETISASPEFADCLSAAGAHHVSVKEVMAAAAAAFRREQK